MTLLGEAKARASDVCARALRGDLRHQSMDGSETLVARQLRADRGLAQGMGPSASRHARLGRRDRIGSCGARSSGFGVHRQRRRCPRWQGAGALAMPSAKRKSRIGKPRSHAQGSRINFFREQASDRDRARRRRRLCLGSDTKSFLDGIRPALRCRCARAVVEHEFGVDVVALELADALLPHGHGAASVARWRSDLLSERVHGGGPHRDPPPRAGRKAY